MVNKTRPLDQHVLCHLIRTIALKIISLYLPLGPYFSKFFFTASSLRPKLLSTPKCAQTSSTVFVCARSICTVRQRLPVRFPFENLSPSQKKFHREIGPDLPPISGQMLSSRGSENSRQKRRVSSLISTFVSLLRSRRSDRVQKRRSSLTALNGGYWKTIVTNYPSSASI